MLFGLALDVVARPWEKYILTLHFSEVGAVPLRAHLEDNLSTAGCRPFRPRPSINNDISFVSNDLWRHTGKVCTPTADQFVTELG
jgi:hypothetical protein